MSPRYITKVISSYFLLGKKCYRQKNLAKRLSDKFDLKVIVKVTCLVVHYYAKIMILYTYSKLHPVYPIPNSIK